MAQVKAQLNSLRISPRKVRAVVNLLRNKDANEALGQLEYTIKRSSPYILKLLKSAIANAENNYEMVKDNLYIKEIAVDEGVKLKRYKPKGFGKVMPIHKKTSGIRLVLEEKVPGLKIDVSRKVKEDDSAHQSHDQSTELVEKKHQEGMEDTKKPEIKKELGVKSNLITNIGRRLFRRKSI